MQQILKLIVQHHGDIANVNFHAKLMPWFGSQTALRQINCAKWWSRCKPPLLYNLAANVSKYLLNYKKLMILNSKTLQPTRLNHLKFHRSCSQTHWNCYHRNCYHWSCWSCCSQNHLELLVCCSQNHLKSWVFSWTRLPFDHRPIVVFLQAHQYFPITLSQSSLHIQTWTGDFFAIALWGCVAIFGWRSTTAAVAAVATMMCCNNDVLLLPAL